MARRCSSLISLMPISLITLVSGHSGKLAPLRLKRTRLRLKVREPVKELAPSHGGAAHFYFFCRQLPICPADTHISLLYNFSCFFFCLFCFWQLPADIKCGLIIRYKTLAQISRDFSSQQKFANRA